MNKDILDVVEALSNKRGVEGSVIFAAIEEALATVAAKRYDESEDVKVRVTIDHKTGDYETFRTWTVVADTDEDPYEYPGHELTIEQAHKIDPELVVGDVVEETIDNPEFGRIAAQQARQVIMQKVREAERDMIAKQFEDKVGQIMIGQVKKATREYAILDMGDQAEALLTREEMLPREMFRANDRVRCYLYAVRNERRGPQLLVSRTHPNMLRELFTIEVPEIGEEVIEIKAVARDPGSRAKIAVKTNDGRIDPIGACVGMRGARVQAVSNELAGERVDIVLWDDSPAQLVINAMAPAEVASIVVDEDNHCMDIAVKEEFLSQAIGRNGQNVRLASELTGWTLNVMSEDDAAAKTASEGEKIRDKFMERLDLEAEVAEVLVEEGFTTVEEVAYVDESEMAEIDGFDAEIVAELQNRAKDYLLTQEIVSQEQQQPEDDMFNVDGMTDELARELAAKGVITRDDLAEMAVDELTEVIEMNEEQAAKLIMAARAHWFTE